MSDLRRRPELAPDDAAVKRSAPAELTPATELRPLVRCVDAVSLATTWDPYLSIRALASYSSLSERLLRGFLTAADRPMPHYRVGGRVLVKRSDFDAWLQVFRHDGDEDAETITKRILDDLDARPRAPHSRTA